MELFGRGCIVLCLALFAPPLRCTRITGSASLAASTALPDFGNQQTATDALDAALMQEVITTTNVSKDDVTKSQHAADHKEQQIGRNFNQAGAHPRSQIASELDLSSTVVEDGKAKMRPTRMEKTQRVLGENLVDSNRDIAEAGSDVVPGQEAGSSTTTHSSNDDVIKSFAGEEAAGKHDKRTFKQTGVHPRSQTKSEFNVPSTITPDGKGSLIDKLQSKPFVFLEVFGIFALMGVLGYMFSLCL